MIQDKEFYRSWSSSQRSRDLGCQEACLSRYWFQGLISRSSQIEFNDVLSILEPMKNESNTDHWAIEEIELGSLRVTVSIVGSSADVAEDYFHYVLKKHLPDQMVLMSLKGIQ